MPAGELNAQLATASLGIGLIFALVCYLATNLSPGGMITPGWVAVSVLTDYRQTLVTTVIPAMTSVCHIGTLKMVMPAMAMKTMTLR